MRVKKKRLLKEDDAVFGCESLNILDEKTTKYFARILFILYGDGTPVKFCQRVDEFGQKIVYAIQEQCFRNENGVPFGDENGRTVPEIIPQHVEPVEQHNQENGRPKFRPITLSHDDVIDGSD